MNRPVQSRMRSGVGLEARHLRLPDQGTNYSIAKPLITLTALSDS